MNFTPPPKKKRPLIIRLLIIGGLVMVGIFLIGVIAVALESPQERAEREKLAKQLAFTDSLNNVKENNKTSEPASHTNMTLKSEKDVGEKIIIPYKIVRYELSPGQSDVFVHLKRVNQDTINVRNTILEIAKDFNFSKSTEIGTRMQLAIWIYDNESDAKEKAKKTEWVFSYFKNYDNGSENFMYNQRLD